MQEETSPNSNNILSPSSPSEKRNNENSLPQNNIPPFEAKSSLLSLDNGQNNNENSIDMERKVVEESPKGRFQRFAQELGSGSQKRVYLAYDTDTGCEVAWNSVLVDIKDSESIQKIKMEIEILKPLKHPNIINFIYCFYNEEKSEIVFITELFSGGSLSQHLSEFKHPRLRVVKLWCLEILKGLKYLHEHVPPIIHRDIKCDNIFINKNTGEVKIGDLGLGIILKDTEYANQFCGTIEYCSPEVYQKKYGVKCDIYSFGISMIEMITGEKPYSECKGQILVVCDKVRKHILPECFYKINNDKAKEFILKCLKPENERPSASELLQDEFLNDENDEKNNYPAIDLDNKKNIISVKSSGLFMDEKNSKDIISLEDLSIEEKSNFTYNNVINDNKFRLDSFSNNKSENNANNIEILKKNLEINPFENETKTEIYFLLDEAPDKNKDINNLNEINNNDIYKIFLVKKKGENISKFKFNYMLNTDTIQGVINELAKIVNLNNEDLEECEKKLKIFISELKAKNEEKEKNEMEQQINLINNCYDIFIKEYNDNLKQIQELNQLYQEIKGNEKDYTKEEILDIDNKMKILSQLK